MGNTTGNEKLSDQFSGIIDRLDTKESLEKLGNEKSINLIKNMKKDAADEKLESEHAKNEIYADPHRTVINNVSSDESVKIGKNEYIDSKGNLVNDIVNKDQLRTENEDSEIIENHNNLESNKFSII